MNTLKVKFWAVLGLCLSFLLTGVGFSSARAEDKAAAKAQDEVVAPIAQSTQQVSDQAADNGKVEKKKKGKKGKKKNSRKKKAKKIAQEDQTQKEQEEKQ